ncbi:MAG: thiol-disulfide oxidoreductase DCC family protein [Cytophagales bacterium]
MNKSVVLFDGVCNLCNSSVNFIIDHDPKMKYKFAALQSDIGREMMKKHSVDTQYFDSVILLENEKYYTKSTAALKIARHLSGAWPVFYYLFIIWPPFIRNAIYDMVAKNRYRIFGKTEACRMPTPELKERFL